MRAEMGISTITTSQISMTKGQPEARYDRSLRETRNGAALSQRPTPHPIRRVCPHAIICEVLTVAPPNQFP